MTKRFVILADVHLGLEGLQPDGLTYGDVGILLRRAVERARQLNPDHIILLGDLVNRGYELEYRRVKEILEPIRARCVPILGNHELQRASIADFERNMQTCAFRPETIAGLRAIILSSGLEGLPDSEWQGAVSADQLHFVEQEISRLSAEEPLLVFVHHPIVGTVRDSDKPMLGLINSRELLSQLQKHAGRVIVFSAHTHAQSFVTRDRFAWIGAPPLGFWPHAMIVVEVEDNPGIRQLRFQTIRLLDRVEESPDPGTALADYRAAREGEVSDRSGAIALARA